MTDMEVEDLGQHISRRFNEDLENVRNSVLNMGGLHHRDGRKRILPYVCLDADDIVALEGLRDHGVIIECADVPNCERKDLFACLGSMASGI